MKNSREFWIRKDEIQNIGNYKFTSAEISIEKPDLKNDNHSDFVDCIHVIEYSAIAEKDAEIARLKEELEQRKVSYDAIDDANIRLNVKCSVVKSALVVAVEALSATWPNVFQEIYEHHQSALAKIMDILNETKKN